MERYALSQKRLDYRAALICSVIANVNRGKRQKAFKPKDFMPRERRRQTHEEMLAYVKAMQAAWDKGVEK